MLLRTEDQAAVQEGHYHLWGVLSDCMRRVPALGTCLEVRTSNIVFFSLMFPTEAQAVKGTTGHTYIHHVGLW